MLKLDLGSGRNPAPGYKGVDILPEADFSFDLCDGTIWPFADESVDGLCSFHFIEHIPLAEIPPVWRDSRPQYRQDAFFWFFDEAWRICKTGAFFQMRWPAHNSVWAFQDPTHRRFIPPNTMGYLSRAGREVLRVPQYARCNWELAEPVLGAGNERDGILEYVAVLRKDP